jgi:DNA-binding NarL/FixJ family response regulator
MFKGSPKELRRVLIVDDHAGFRASARRLLECNGYEVVGEAADGAEALRLADELAPQLVLVDIHLPDADGRYVAGRISGGRDAPAVVLISSRDVADLGDSIERAGARGFISKAELSGESLAALLT